MERIKKLIKIFLEKKETIDQCQFFPDVFAFKITTKEDGVLFYINRANKEFSEISIEPRTYPIFKIPYSHFRELITKGTPKHWIEALEQGHIKKITD